MKTIIVLSCTGALSALLGCTASAEPTPTGEDPAALAQYGTAKPSDVAATGIVTPDSTADSIPNSTPADGVIREARRAIRDPRAGGPVFQAAVTLPSPLKEVSR